MQAVRIAEPREQQVCVRVLEAAQHSQADAGVAIGIGIGVCVSFSIELLA